MQFNDNLIYLICRSSSKVIFLILSKGSSRNFVHVIVQLLTKFVVLCFLCVLCVFCFLFLSPVVVLIAVTNYSL